MFSNGKKHKTAKIDSLIGQNTEIRGDIIFSGGFHVDGKVMGNIQAEESSSLLTLSDHGVIEGDVRVPNVILNGKVLGDVYATERIELAANARVTGNVYYNLIEMAIGAEVNGSLVHRVDASTPDAPWAKEEKKTV
jgi:cytoskeletal protein CcmA (bactofilin family)